MSQNTNTVVLEKVELEEFINEVYDEDIKNSDISDLFDEMEMEAQEIIDNKYFSKIEVINYIEKTLDKLEKEINDEPNSDDVEFLKEEMFTLAIQLESIK